MKIILVNKFLYPKGGDAICTLETGRLLAERGHQVVYWGMAHPNNPPYPHADIFIDNVDFENPGGPREKLRTALNVLYSREAKRKFSRLIEREAPDIVHLHNFAHQISPSILPVLKKRKIPAVMTMHDYKMVCPAYALLVDGKPCRLCQGGKYYQCFLHRCTKHSRVKSLVNTVEMYLHHKILHLYNTIDTFIAPSRFMKDKCEEMGFRGHIVHLSNFADLTDFHPEYQWTERKLVYLGRLSAEKGLPTLLAAAKGLDVRIQLIGDGPLREELMDKAKREGITNIDFAGYRTGHDLHREIQAAMGVVLTSECFENNPRSVLEAFALGKPVIGARIGGIPELVRDHETGITFEAGNPDDLRDKIRQLTAQPDQISIMGKNGRAFVEQNFSANHHYDQLMTIYQRARDRSQNA